MMTILVAFDKFLKECDQQRCGGKWKSGGGVDGGNSNMKEVNKHGRQSLRCL